VEIVVAATGAALSLAALAVSVLLARRQRDEAFLLSTRC
jgi:hypothetical protein